MMSSCVYPLCRDYRGQPFRHRVAQDVLRGGAGTYAAQITVSPCGVRDCRVSGLARWIIEQNKGADLRHEKPL